MVENFKIDVIVTERIVELVNCQKCESCLAQLSSFVLNENVSFVISVLPNTLSVPAFP